MGVCRKSMYMASQLIDIQVTVDRSEFVVKGWSLDMLALVYCTCVGIFLSTNIKRHGTGCI